MIFDVDGTLVDTAPVRHYLTQDDGTKDFNAFHGASAFCPPIPETIEAMHQARRDGHQVVVVTARKAKWRILTLGWMRSVGAPFDIHHVYMRRDYDRRHDVEVKRDILAVIQQDFDVVHAFDDNPNVIALWVENGIPVTVVPGYDPVIPPAPEGALA